MKDKFIIGRKPVLDAVKSGTELEKVWISKTLKGDIEKDIRNLTRQQAIPLQYVPKEKLNAIVKNKLHQGVVAQLSAIQYMSIEEVIPFLYDQGKTPAFLILDGVEDVRNIGALERSAVWFAFDAIVIALKGNARINSFAHKASAGAIKDIIICREVSMIKALNYLKASGVNIIAMEAHEQTEKASDFDPNSPLAILLGSEEKGISREAKALADHCLSIAGTFKVESLNVSVAGAIAMHQIFEKRNGR